MSVPNGTLRAPTVDHCPRPLAYSSASVHVVDERSTLSGVDDEHEPSLPKGGAARHPLQPCQDPREAATVRSCRTMSSATLGATTRRQVPCVKATPGTRAGDRDLEERHRRNRLRPLRRTRGHLDGVGKPAGFRCVQEAAPDRSLSLRGDAEQDVATVDRQGHAIGAVIDGAVPDVAEDQLTDQVGRRPAESFGNLGEHGFAFRRKCDGHLASSHPRATRDRQRRTPAP